jgi:hypothetical protein
LCNVTPQLQHAVPWKEGGQPDAPRLVRGTGRQRGGPSHMSMQLKKYALYSTKAIINSFGCGVEPSGTSITPGPTERTCNRCWHRLLLPSQPCGPLHPPSPIVQIRCFQASRMPQPAVPAARALLDLHAPPDRCAKATAQCTEQQCATTLGFLVTRTAQLLFIQMHNMSPSNVCTACVQPMNPCRHTEAPLGFCAGRCLQPGRQ